MNFAISRNGPKLYANLAAMAVIMFTSRLIPLPEGLNRGGFKPYKEFLMKKTAFISFALGLLSLFCHANVRAAQEAAVKHPAKTSARMDPASIREYTASLDGFKRAWKVYLPKRCEGIPSPMVVGLHGFGGPSEAYRNAWSTTAERAGFIAVFPEAISPRWWNIWEMGSLPESPDDVRFLHMVIEKMCDTHAVDTDRIYLTGVSMGDNMSTTFAFRHADIFAAIAPTDGPTLPSILIDEQSGAFLKKPAQPVPSLRLHGELDCMAGLPSTYQQYKITNDEYQSVIPLEEKQKLRHSMDEMMKSLWLNANGCAKAPVFHLDTRRNIAMYEGKGNYDCYAYTIVNEGHGEGYKRENDAWPDFLWDEFLSGFRRKDGKIVKLPPVAPVLPDRNAVAIAAGATQACVDNRLVAIPEGRVMHKDGTLFVPVAFLPAAFPGTELTLSDDGKTAHIRFEGRAVKVQSNAPLSLSDARESALPMPFSAEDGLLMAPMGFLAENFYGMHYAENSHTAYISDHPVHLTYDFAASFRTLLGADKALPADIAQEKAVVQKILASRRESGK